MERCMWIAVAVALCAAPMFAATVANVTLDLDAVPATMLIVGFDFGGTEGQVFLATSDGGGVSVVTLATNSWSDGAVEAVLPATPLPPGTCLLVLDPETGQSAFFNISFPGVTAVTAGPGLLGGGSEGTVSLEVDASVARDDEVLGIVLASDGAGSGLDADLLDALDSDDIVEVAGDMMTGTLTLSPAAGEALLTTSGSVGIGVAEPRTLLDVAGTGTFEARGQRLYIGEPFGGSNEVGLFGTPPDGGTETLEALYLSPRNANASNSGYIAMFGPTVADITERGDVFVRAGDFPVNDMAGDITMRTGGSNGTPGLLHLDFDGSVGIGTTSPGNALHVIGGASIGTNFTDGDRLVVRDSVQFTDSQGNAVGTWSTSVSAPDLDFHITESSVDVRMAVQKDSGNVGIGTIDPGARLEVEGGDAAVSTQGSGLVLRATDGSNCFRITVDNSGVLSTDSVACP